MVVNELYILNIMMYIHNVDNVKKRNTARSANLHVLIYTLLYRKVSQQVVYTWFTVEKHSVVVACGDETLFRSSTRNGRL